MLEMMGDALLSSSSLPQDFLSLVFEAAKTSGDLKILATLAARSDIPLSVREFLSVDARPLVRASYLSRADVPDEEFALIFSDTPSKDLLDELFQLTRRNFGLLERLEASFLSNPSEALALRLVDSGSDQVFLATLPYIDPDSLTLFQLESALERIRTLSLNFQSAVFIAERVDQGALLHPLMEQGGLPDHLQAKVIRRVADFVLTPLDDVVYLPSLERSWERFCNKLARLLDAGLGPLAFETVLGLRSLPRLSSFPQGASLLDAMLVEHHALNPTRSSCPRIISELGDALFFASSASSQEVLERVFEYASLNGSSQVFSRLWLNPALPESLAVKVLGFILDGRPLRVSSDVFVSGLRVHKDMLSLLDMAYVSHWHFLLSTFGLDLYPDPTSGAVSALSAMNTACENRFLSSDHRAFHRVPSISIDYVQFLNFLTRAQGVDCSALFPLVPWPVFKAYGERAELSSFKTALTEAQMTALGSDLAAWETFAVLSENFEGSVMELLVAAASLS